MLSTFQWGGRRALVAALVAPLLLASGHAQGTSKAKLVAKKLFSKPGTWIAKVSKLKEGLGRAESDDPRIVGGNESYKGTSMAEWTERYYKWLLGTPWEKHPANGGPLNAYNTQDKDVWFLPQGFKPDPSRRRDVIPHGKALYIPLATTEISTAPGDDGYYYARPRKAKPDSPLTADDMRQRATFGNRTQFVKLVIDGEEVGNLNDHEHRTSLFQYKVPDYPHPNAVTMGWGASGDGSTGTSGGAPGGTTHAHYGETYDSIASANSVIVKPLPKGKHTIAWEVHWKDTFVNKIRWDIEVR